MAARVSALPASAFPCRADTRFAPMPGPAAGTIGCVSVALPRHGRGIGTAPVTRASQILSQAGHPACRIGWTSRETFYRRAATSPGGDTPCSTPPSDPQPLIVAYGAQVRQDMPAGRWCRGKGRQVSQPATDGDRQLALPSRSQAGLEPVRLSLSVTAPGPRERSTPRASPPLCALILVGCLVTEDPPIGAIWPWAAAVTAWRGGGK